MVDVGCVIVWGKEGDEKLNIMVWGNGEKGDVTLWEHIHP